MKNCKKCHKDKPLTEFYTNKGAKDGHRNICKQCTSSIMKDSYSEDIKTYNRLRYHNEDIKVKKLAYEKSRYNDPSFKLKRDAYNKQYREANKKRARALAVSTKGRLKAKVKAHRRRARKLELDDKSVTTDYLEQLKQNQNNKCYYCNSILEYDKDNAVHLDHYIPLSKGGLHSIGNIVYACKHCNLKKSNTIPSTPLVFSI